MYLFLIKLNLAWTQGSSSEKKENILKPDYNFQLMSKKLVETDPVW